MQESKELLELILRGIEEDTPYDLVDVDREHLASFLETYESNEGCKFFFIKKEEKIVGVLLGSITASNPLWYGTKVAFELFWYVHPDYRGTKDSIKLINDYERWAKDNGCKYITMACLANTFEKKLTFLYKKRGFKKLEVSFIKEL